MRSNRFFIDQPLHGASEVSVSGATAHYLMRVIRLRVGAELVVFDGHGGEYAATLTEASRDKLQLELGAHSDPQRESPLQITLAQGVARGEHMGLVLQKGTELGVSAIAPLLTEHTVVRLDERRAEKRREHWQKTIISACEQCGRNTLPQLHPLHRFEQWLTTLADDGLRLILQPDATTRLADLVDPRVDPRVDAAADAVVTVLIGPEGGLSQNEQQLARQKNFVAVSLGPRVLRTETAAIAILAILQSRWGDAR